jgi:hypothetical protein
MALDERIDLYAIKTQFERMTYALDVGALAGDIGFLRRARRALLPLPLIDRREAPDHTQAFPPFRERPMAAHQTPAPARRTKHRPQSPKAATQPVSGAPRLEKPRREGRCARGDHEFRYRGDGHNGGPAPKPIADRIAIPAPTAPPPATVRPHPRTPRPG